MGRKFVLAPLDNTQLKEPTAAAAEKALEITRSLIDLAKIQNDLSKPLTV